LKIAGHLQSLAFHPNGKGLLMASDAGVQLWDWEARRLLHRDDPLACQLGRYFPDTTKALVCSFGNLREWSLTEQPSRPTRYHPEAGIDRFAISPDGQCVLVSESATKSARVWDVATGKLLGPAPSPLGARPVAFSPDGRLLAVGSRDGRISICATPSPIGGDPERIRTWVEAATGLELDREGVVMPLAFVARSARVDRLRELGGPPLASPPLLGP
jgi:WD40 repeat protein